MTYRHRVCKKKKNMQINVYTCTYSMFLFICRKSSTLPEFSPVTSIRSVPKQIYILSKCSYKVSFNYLTKYCTLYITSGFLFVCN